jgi:outer membrane protein OmpA-like peptidoglycan-associated protein
MSRIFSLILVTLFLGLSITKAQFGDLINKAKDKAIEEMQKKDKDKEKTATNESKQEINSDNTSSAKTNQLPDTKAYQNFDFVPGDRILFEDNFLDDQSGEFPSHWDLLSGQAQVSSFQGEKIFALTEGNYVSVIPLMKTDNYLASDTFSVEFDFYTQPGAYNQVGLRLWDPKNPQQSEVAGGDDKSTVFVGNTCISNGLSGSYPKESFINNKWHHVAIARKGNQLKVYEDQYRILNVPVFKGKTYALNIVGIGDQEKPIMLKNIRIAQGGSFNDTKRILSEPKSRIITHGILFDIDKASIKPQSMGTINEIFQFLKDDPSLKFEIDGHTDNTGESQHNLQLSQQRADAVKSELIEMGIDPSRLTSKGYGDSKPITDNSSPEGKANNRRVEFVKF